MKESNVTDGPLNRRDLLRLLSGAVGGVIVAGCGGGSAAASSSESATASTNSTSSSTGSTTTSPSSEVTPEGEIGPYFTDDSANGYNRSNITANLDGTSVQTGIPLVLKLYVYDSENSNAPVSGSQIDIWHCNASGVYSNESVESSIGENWLRGYQLTDSTGLVTFKTIVPGWYSGRTTHIHIRVRSSYSEASSTSDETNTTQLFFPQTLVDYIDSNIAPYNSNGTDPTTNSSDQVYTPQTEGKTLLTLVGDNINGYTSTYAIYLPITDE